MTTGQQVFEWAMHLMDETRQSTGAVDVPETRGYKHRVVPILNILQQECLPCSDTWAAETPGQRPVCPLLTGLEQALALDDGLCRLALPYGLCAHLLLGEDDQRAGFFQQRYEEKLGQLRRELPAEAEDIALPYGGVEMGQFARW